MNTPIIDFIKEYKKKNTLRLHMPGHKGKSFLGMEGFDITEIDGADVLYSANGIIKESQNNASALFHTAKTLYSCEGSSLSIRAMLYLALLSSGSSKTILAARNSHKVFISAAALLDFEIEWMFSQSDTNIITCSITADELDQKLSSMCALGNKPVAFYVTSPDYLGNIADIKGLSEVCHKHDVLLLCDNAHGAYLNFLPCSKHPIALGADMCCDSAHKTLPVLTGGAYLHISKTTPAILSENAQRALALFASTSPSYLVLQSLDYANAYLSNGYKEKLHSCMTHVYHLKEVLIQYGYDLIGDEELKLTIAPKGFGYTGYELVEYLSKQNIVCEFADNDYVVFMFTPEINEIEFKHLEYALLNLSKKEPLSTYTPTLSKPVQVMRPREAMFSKSYVLPVENSLGKVLASENVSCPPAIPIVVCGEKINESAIEMFQYYGISEVRVIE
ncbi:MAG: aminotransferase class V-fold PLP-dependent enzyme [Agathobacter sp.]|nr:aminotransferase class V-fold PLP-dependent enzyme [Agathobacter sp.]